MNKKNSPVLLTILLLSILFTNLSFAAKPVVINKKEFGEGWPFKREEIYIQCLDNQRIIAINPGSLASYALNENAIQASKTLNGYKPVEDILSGDDKPKDKGLSRIIDIGKQHCD